MHFERTTSILVALILGPACGEKGASTSSARAGSSSAAATSAGAGAPGTGVEAKSGGKVQILDKLQTGGKDVEMKIGQAFAYVVLVDKTDDEGKKIQVRKIYEINLYNDGATGVTCSTNMGEFKDKKLIGGSNLGLSLQGRSELVTLDESLKLPVNAGSSFSPCVFGSHDYGKGVEQSGTCGFAFIGDEDIKITAVTKETVSGTLSVDKGGEHIKGDFVAKICPLTEEQWDKR